MQINAQRQIHALICQTSPLIKDKAANISHLRSEVAQYSKNDCFDLVMLPEMALIGYNFKGPLDIFPYTELCGSGDSFQLCRDMAKRLNSFVVYGYAEKESKTKDGPTDAVGQCNLFNSACMIDRQGNVVMNARKTHLYYSDQLWCQKGDGFKKVTITNLEGQPIECAIGICMDINPEGFVSGKYQLADFVKKNRCEVLLFLSAWNDGQPDQLDEERSQTQILNYWLNRLKPLMNLREDQKQPLLFLVCDRVGEEQIYTQEMGDRTNFIGTSCALTLNPVGLISRLCKKKEGFLKVKANVNFK